MSDRQLDFIQATDPERYAQITAGEGGAQTNQPVATQLAAAGGSGGGGTFTADPDQMRGIAGRLDEIAERIVATNTRHKGSVDGAAVSVKGFSLEGQLARTIGAWTDANTSIVANIRASADSTRVTANNFSESDKDAMTRMPGAAGW